MGSVALLALANPLEHVVQHTYVGGHGAPVILSNHVVMEILAAVLLIVILPRAMRRRPTGDEVEDLTPRGAGNFFESICQFLRNDVARPALHDHTDRFIPYIWSVFFFILFCNLLGLLPLEPISKLVLPFGVGGTATGNIWVTGTLAVCTLLMIIFNGLRYNGKAYLAHFFQGPIFVSWLIALLEVVGLAAKTFALAVRLFANMVAGHILLAVFLSFIAMAGASSAALGIAVAVPSVAASVAFYFLELFVAFLQAFIFTFLTAVFIGQAVIIHHDRPGEGHVGAEVADH
jgi:F-type H+-transporting ATPase subunit a